MIDLMVCRLNDCLQNDEFVRDQVTYDDQFRLVTLDCSCWIPIYIMLKNHDHGHVWLISVMSLYFYDSFKSMQYSSKLTKYFSIVYPNSI